MPPDDATRSVFDPVDVSGYESIAQPRHAQNTDTGAHPALKVYWRVEDGVSVSTLHW